MKYFNGRQPGKYCEIRADIINDVPYGRFKQNWVETKT